MQNWVDFANYSALLAILLLTKRVLSRETFVAFESFNEKGRKTLRYFHYGNSLDVRFIVQFSGGRFTEVDNRRKYGDYVQYEYGTSKLLQGISVS